ncbi:MAG: 50S ribosomal protein L1 [Planctomycetes bacterium]|nr:50S ribosomal protein L1 [Planctomycetota bacterium]
MKSRSKRYKKLAELVDSEKKYEIDNAIEIIKKMDGTTKFDQTVLLTLSLGIDPKKADQLIRGSVSLPKGIGKTRKVIVFAEGEDATKATAAGADEVGSAELVKKIEGGWLDFDVAIACTYMMRHIGKLGKVLGPQGKMPSPKAGTVTDDIKTAVTEFKAGRIEFRADAGGVVHAPVGKLSFSQKDLKANLESFIEHIKNMKPASVKGTYIINAFLSGTMTPSIGLVIK